MIELVLTIIAAIVAIGVLVTVHEYGHYIVARKLGIKVLRFSVGFGKPIWRKVAGPDRTEYVISRIPLGGYVKMLDGREGPVDPADAGRAFNQKSVAARSAVLVAGPLANFLFAIAAFWLVFSVGVPETRPVVGEVTAGSAAERAGVLPGDEIEQVEGRDVPTWSEANIALLEATIDEAPIALKVRGEKGRLRDLTLRVEGNRRALTEPGRLLPGLGIVPWTPKLPATVGALAPDAPAVSAGLSVGDQIVALDDVVIGDWDALVAELVARPGRQVKLEVLRDGLPRTLYVQLGAREFEGQLQGWLGITVATPEDYRALWGDHITVRKWGVVPAFTRAVGETWDKSALMLSMFWKMIIGKVSIENLSGPISIAQYAGLTAQDGPVYYLRFLALLSLSLGVLNLLPIPMLDGGQLVYQLAEAVKGSPVSVRTEIIGQQIGMVMLILLMGLAISQDIGRFAIP